MIAERVRNAVIATLKEQAQAHPSRQLMSMPIDVTSVAKAARTSAAKVREVLNKFDHAVSPAGESFYYPVNGYQTLDELAKDLQKPVGSASSSRHRPTVENDGVHRVGRLPSHAGFVSRVKGRRRRY